MPTTPKSVFALIDDPSQAVLKASPNSFGLLLGDLNIGYYSTDPSGHYNERDQLVTHIHACKPQAIDLVAIDLPECEDSYTIGGNCTLSEALRRGGGATTALQEEKKNRLDYVYFASRSGTPASSIAHAVAVLSWSIHDPHVSSGQLSCSDHRPILATLKFEA